MSKKVNCCRCNFKTAEYNRFDFSFAQPEYKFNGTHNTDKFILCHVCTDKLSIWLEASRENESLNYQ